MLELEHHEHESLVPQASSVASDVQLVHVSNCALLHSCSCLHHEQTSSSSHDEALVNLVQLTHSSLFDMHDIVV